MPLVSEQELAAVRASDLFDAEWYLSRYPDVAMLGIDPAEHYLWIGARLGRDPSPKFSTLAYLEKHHDVASKRINPLGHYLRWGKEEGRTLNLEGRRTRRRKVQSPASYIESGPFRIKRHYKQFDLETEAHFLTEIGHIYSENPDRFDAICTTIVMPTYNRGDKIEVAIRSVIAQNHENWRLMIVDDGSQDNTSEVVASFLDDKRIEYVRVDRLGVSGARNVGIERSSGEYIAYLDSDNSWCSKFLRSMIVFLETQELDAAYSGIHSTDDNGETVCYRGDVFVWSACLKANYVDLNPFMHRRDMVVAGGREERFDTSLRRFVDWDFILRLTGRARVSYAPFIGVEYYDGEAGGRITRTEYQNEEASRRIEAIRSKHDVHNTSIDCLDTGSGIALASLRRTELHASPRHFALRFYPDYTVANAYQNLLYEPMTFPDIGPGDIDDCLRLLHRSVYEDDAVTFHIHWTNPIFAPSANPEAAQEAVDAFIAKLRLFKALGGRVIWTIHNVTSHEPKFPEQEMHLNRELADLADWVHVHHSSVSDATLPHYELPASKMVVAEHGSYIGTLPDEVSSKQARTELGIDENDTLFLFLGQVRGYKGIGELISAFQALRASDEDCSLVIAGKVLGLSEDEVRQELAGCPKAVFHPGYVPDERMQIYLNAADAMVLPYRKVLTSGSVFLALSFGLPVICPRSGLLADIVEHEYNGLLYDPNDTGGLLAAMTQFRQLERSSHENMRKAAKETAKSCRWEETAAKLQRHIEGLDFGRVVQPDIDGIIRTWFVRGDEDLLRNKSCIAIVLHYQNIEDTRECIRRLQAQSNKIGILLISNNERIDDIWTLASAFPDCVSVQSEENVGYAAANNFGLRLCREFGSEYFWIVNPDIVVPDGYFNELCARVSEWPESDFFGSTIVPAHDPSKVLFCGGSVNLEQGAAPSHMHMGKSVDDLPDSAFQCDYLTGANIFGRTKALSRSGYLPEDYFLYFEETHWFLEMAEKSQVTRPIVFPDLIIENHKRSENGLVPSRYYIYYFIRNSLHFGRRFAPLQTSKSEREARRFADAWLAKIGRAAPDRLEEFEKLVQLAFRDGRAGVTDRVALI